MVDGKILPLYLNTVYDTNISPYGLLFGQLALYDLETGAIFTLQEPASVTTFK
jgi:hypothetical protein